VPIHIARAGSYPARCPAPSGVPTGVAQRAYPVLGQGIMLSLEIALWPTPLPALAKTVLVASVGVAASFFWGWLLVAKTPLRRLL